MAVNYSESEKDRELIIKRRQRETAKSFERMRRQIDSQISEMNMSTVSERVRRQQLEEIRYSLQKQLGVYYSDLEDGLKSDMVSIGESVLNDSTAFYNALNMPVSMSITSFPVEIMENVVNGTVYGQKWFLSDALWGDYQSKLGQINDIVTQGIGMNLSSLDIAKQLEQYVDPKAMKPSQAIVTKCLRDPATGKLYSMDYVKRHPEKDWSNFTEKTSRYYYGKVDYNAQRLARTLVSHAYQQNVVRQAQANPFASGVKWEASGGERMCEICEERDGKIFPVDDVPLDHPNGMCTFTVETPSMMEMSDNLAKWVNGEPTEWDDQLNAYYEGRPIEHKSIANASGKEEIEKAISESPDDYNNIDPGDFTVYSDKMDISSDEYDHINNYSWGYIGTSNSFDINKALRFGNVEDDLSKRSRQTVAMLTDIINRNQLDDPCKFFRMVGSEFLTSQLGLSEKDADSLLFNADKPNVFSKIVGTIQQEKGFMSASAIPGKNVFGSRPVKLNILAPEGSKCFFTDNVHESEVIFAPGTKYKIIDMSIVSGKYTDVVELTCLIQP